MNHNQATVNLDAGSPKTGCRPISRPVKTIKIPQFSAFTFRALKRIGTLDIATVHLLLLLTTFDRLDAAGGVFIFNESKVHPASAAKAYRYASLKHMGAVTAFQIPSGHEVKITQYQPLVILPDVDPSSQRSITASDTAAYVQQLTEFKAAYDKYPNARSLLEQQLKVLNGTVSNLKAGKVWFEERWMDAMEADHIRAQRATDAEFKERQALKKQRKKQIDEELGDLNERLEAAQQRLTEMSNDRDELASKRREAADKAKRSAEALLQIINR